MSVRVFLSHSVAPWELALVNGVADVAARQGAVPIIPDRDWNPQSEVPQRVVKQIIDADYIIAIASQFGRHPAWLNQELAHGQKLSKPSVVVADADIQVVGGYKCIRIDRKNPWATLSQVGQQIQDLVQDRQTRNLLGGLLIGGLALLFLSSLKGE